MFVQPITNQPKFEGRLVGKGVLLLKDSHWDVPAGLDKYSCLEIPDNLLNKVRKMIKEKPYDVFVSPNRNNKELLDIDANYSYEAVKNGIRGQVKIARNAIEALPQAVQEAFDTFEKSFKTTSKHL